MPWRENEAMYGPGGGEWVDDNGTITPDPFGVLNQPGAAPQSPAPVASYPQTGQGPGAAFTPPAPAPMLNTEIPDAAQGALGPEFAASQQAGAQQTVQTGQAAPQQPFPDLEGKQGHSNQALGKPAPFPDLEGKQGHSNSGGAPPPDFVQTTSSKESTTGLSKDDAARTQAGIGRQQAAQGRSDQSAVGIQQLQADQAKAQAVQSLASAAAGFRDVAAKQAVQDHISSEVDRRLNAGGPNSKDTAGLGSVYWRPDRAELFHGDNGVAFGISAAVAAMAGAWMQGRGLTGQNPYLPTVIKMIDDNVDDQVRQNSSAFQHLKEIKGDVKAAKLELKERQLAYVQQQADGLALRDKSEILQAGVAGLSEKLAAEREKTRNEQEKVLNRTVTNEVSRQMVANPAAAAYRAAQKHAAERTPEQAKAQATVQSLDAFYKQAGLVRDGSGKWVVGKGILPPGFVESINPFSDNAIRTHGEAAVESYGRLQSGGVIGGDERAAFQDQVGLNTGNREQLAAKANALDVAMRERLRSSDAAGSPARKDALPDENVGGEF
jgi:hypothetical protein